MDHGGETLIGFVAAHGNAFELFDLAEEVLDQMAPFIDFRIDVERAFTPWTLGNDDFRSTFVHVRDNPIRIKSFAGDAGAKLDVLGGATPIVSWRFPGNRTKRTRLPKASGSARILAVRPPLDLPMAWPGGPLSRPVRGGGP